MVEKLKAVRGIYRCREVRAAVARQLLDSDALLQKEALKCLKVSISHLMQTCT